MEKEKSKDKDYILMDMELGDSPKNVVLMYEESVIYINTKNEI